jgi:hypothetical protein
MYDPSIFCAMRTVKAVIPAKAGIYPKKDIAIRWIPDNRWDDGKRMIPAFAGMTNSKATFFSGQKQLCLVQSNNKNEYYLGAPYGIYRIYD